MRWDNLLLSRSQGSWGRVRRDDNGNGHSASIREIMRKTGNQEAVVEQIVKLVRNLLWYPVPVF